MRNVLRNVDEVFHYWANQVQPHGKSGSVSFDGPIVKSYAEPIGYLHNGAVLLRNHGWSVTSGRHCSKAWRAARQYTSINVWSLPRYGEIGNCEHRENRTHFESEIASLALYANNPRMKRTRDRRLEAVQSVVDDYHAYRNLFSLIDWPADPDVAGLTEALKAERDRVEAVRRERAALAETERNERIARQQEALKEWRAGGNPQDRFEQTALRVNEISSEIETTHGATIPIADAIRLWPLLCRQKRAGGVVGDIFTRRLGRYRIDRFDGETLTVGCHQIPWSELELAAKELGLPAYAV
jgi:hypothetical protein